MKIEDSIMTLPEDHLYQNLAKLIKTFSFGQKKIAIACSGGTDSMFLAVFSALILQEGGVRLCAIIVDHKLQSNSTQNAFQAQKNLQQYGVKSTILTWHHEAINTAIEERARNARYSLINDFCHKNNISKVMLAHHVDDKIETFLMNSMRGTGLDGITSMRQSHTMNDIEYFRPMLYLLEKSQIQKYMKAKSISWVEDSSNQNLEFTRNNIRHSHITQLTPIHKQGIIKTIHNLENIRQEIIMDVQNFFQNYATIGSKSILFAKEVFSLNKEIFFRVIKKAILIIHPHPTKELRQNSIHRLYAYLHNANKQKVTLAHCIFEKLHEGLKIYAEVR